MICLFGNSGTGKTTIKNAILSFVPNQPIQEIANLKQNIQNVRYQLESFQTYRSVFVLTTDGGRLLPDDAELLSVFAKRRHCMIVFNKTKFSQTLVNRVQGIWGGKDILIDFIPVLSDMQDMFIHVSRIVPFLFHLKPQPYSPFLFPFEELAQLKQKQMEDEAKHLSATRQAEATNEGQQTKVNNESQQTKVNKREIRT